MELANSGNYLLKHNFSSRSRYVPCNSHFRTSNFCKSVTHKTFSVPGALEDMPPQHISTAKLVKYYFLYLVSIIMAWSVNYTVVHDFVRFGYKSDGADQYRRGLARGLVDYMNWKNVKC